MGMFMNGVRTTGMVIIHRGMLPIQWGLQQAPTGLVGAVAGSILIPAAGLRLATAAVTTAGPTALGFVSSGLLEIYLKVNPLL